MSTPDFLWSESLRGHRGIEKDDRSIPLQVQHPVPMEDVVCRSILLVKICSTRLRVQSFQNPAPADLPGKPRLLGPLDSLQLQASRSEKTASPAPGFGASSCTPKKTTKNKSQGPIVGMSINWAPGLVDFKIRWGFMTCQGGSSLKLVATWSLRAFGTRLDCHQRNGGDIGRVNAHCTFTFLANCERLQLFFKRWDHGIVERLAALLD